MRVANSGTAGQVSVRVKMAALWTAMLFLFAYGDIFGFLQPGRIEEVTAGRISGIKITQVFLSGVSVYVAVASVMIFLSLVLRPGASRWANIVLPVLYLVSIVVSASGEPAYYVFLSVAEGALLLLLIWYAWTWPRQEGTGPLGRGPDRKETVTDLGHGHPRQLCEGRPGLASSGPVINPAASRGRSCRPGWYLRLIIQLRPGVM